MKKGFHSTQDKAWNTIPRSEFLGVAIGFAIGMILHGALQLDSSLSEIVGIAVGFSIGYLVDRMFFLEKDITEEEIQLDCPEIGEAALPAGDCTYSDL
ncbi:MAG: hypothetical protein Q4P20_11515 [Eubacteriales bacterium]|nr:hypothetical protein [Eubacteriales bacterium]